MEVLDREPVIPPSTLGAPASASSGDGPVRPEFLPFALPSIGEEEINAVVQVLRSGWITSGPRTKEFERLFAAHVGASHAIAVSSCTAALHLALAALGVGPGDEVITSPLTFCSTANVIVHLGARPVFADVGEDFNIEPPEIVRRITPRTRAIVPVHFAGQPCRMEEIMACAREHGVPVVEDAAHAVGASYRGRMIGSIGDVTAFSFYATKNITTAEGGMITTENQALAEKIRMLSLHGMSRDAWKRYTSAGSWYYEVEYPGYKDNMTDIQAALGIQQLARLRDFLATRSHYARMYDDAFANLPQVRTPAAAADVTHAWHMYVIRLLPEKLTISRSEFIEALKAENIGTSVHFIPVHLHPYYGRTYGYRRGDYPVAERVYDSIISLPLYPRMTEADVNDVVAAVKKIAARHCL